MYDRPDWMTNTDVLILVAMGSSNLIQVLSPTLLAYNLGMTREHASRRLSELERRGYVRKLEQGKYTLDTTGQEFLNGTFNHDS
ncbi:MAG: DNA-binding IclR family transcriptional regulator [Halobacteriales archaeon]|jgi:DNA-binding IclR family transcriptional regulator